MEDIIYLIERIDYDHETEKFVNYFEGFAIDENEAKEIAEHLNQNPPVTVNRYEVPGEKVLFPRYGYAAVQRFFNSFSWKYNNSASERDRAELAYAIKGRGTHFVNDECFLEYDYIAFDGRIRLAPTGTYNWFKRYKEETKADEKKRLLERLIKDIEHTFELDQKTGVRWKSIEEFVAGLTPEQFSTVQHEYKKLVIN